MREEQEGREGRGDEAEENEEETRSIDSFGLLLHIFSYLFAYQPTMTLDISLPTVLVVLSRLSSLCSLFLHDASPYRIGESSFLFVDSAD